MKTFLPFLFTLLALLAGAILTTGRMPDAALIFAGIFSATLSTWTLRQYERKYLPLSRAKLLRPSLGKVAHEKPLRTHRKAA